MGDAVRCVVVDWEASCAVSGSRDRTIKVWNLSSGVCNATLRGHEDAVWCLDVDWTSRCVLSGSKDSLMKCWDLDRGVCMNTLRGHHGPVLCCAAVCGG